MTRQHKSMRGTNRMYLLGRALPWIQMMDTRWGLMLPLVHHQCSRQSDVRTRASYSMRNQVFNRDSQGPSIHGGKAGTCGGDGSPVFVRVQKEKRVCVRALVLVVTLTRATCLHKDRKMRRMLQILKGFCEDLDRTLYLNDKTDRPNPCDC